MRDHAYWASWHARRNAHSAAHPAVNPAVNPAVLPAWCHAVGTYIEARRVQLAIIGCALVCGALAATGNLVAIGAGLGTLALPYLLARPDKLVSLVIPASLAAGVIVSLAGPGSTALSWSISLLSFALLPVAIFRFLRRRAQPVFLWMALGFVVYCMLVTAVQWITLEQFVAGFKRYFQGYGVLFALATSLHAATTMPRWRKILLMLAFFQLPFALYEFVVMVPMRGGLDAGGEATDVVAGTFGANLEGGSANAEMSAFLLIVLMFLLTAWRMRAVRRRRLLWMGLLCLAPLALGETKIVVVLLPLMILTMLRKEIAVNPRKLMLGAAACIGLTLLLGYLYITIMDRNTVAEAIELITEYNVGQVGYGGNLLNRMTALTFWWDRHDLSDPLHFLFGHGIGSSFWGDNSPLPGHIAVMHPNYGIGLTTAATLLWDVGLVGLLFHGAIFGAAWITANRVWKKGGETWARHDALAVQSALACFLVFILYRDSGVNLLAYEVVVACVLGYLAFLAQGIPDGTAQAGQEDIR
jgi:hypothetical protein